MLERNRCRRKSARFRRRDCLVYQVSGVSNYLDLHLQGAATALSENSSVEIEPVNTADHRWEILRKRVAGEIASRAQCCGMGRAGGSLRVVGNVRSDGPAGNGSIRTERTRFEVRIVQGNWS